LTVSNMNLFATLTANEISCANQIANGFQPLARNADGSLNSCTNPAKLGSAVSFFMHGVGAESLGFPPAQQLFNVQAFVGQCSAAVTKASLIDSFVYKVDVSMPPALLPCGTSYSETSVENSFSMAFNYNGETVGPQAVPVPNGGPFINFAPGQTLPMIVWVTK
jgi:hypothetical protein